MRRFGEMQSRLSWITAMDDIPSFRFICLYRLWTKGSLKSELDHCTSQEPVKRSQYKHYSFRGGTEKKPPKNRVINLRYALIIRQGLQITREGIERRTPEVIGEETWTPATSLSWPTFRWANSQEPPWQMCFKDNRAENWSKPITISAAYISGISNYVE